MQASSGRPGEAGQGKPYLLLISSTAKPTVGASSAAWARLGCNRR